MALALICTVCCILTGIFSITSPSIGPHPITTSTFLHEAVSFFIWAALPLYFLLFNRNYRRYLNQEFFNWNVSVWQSNERFGDFTANCCDNELLSNSNHDVGTFSNWQIPLFHNLVIAYLRTWGGSTHIFIDFKLAQKTLDKKDIPSSNLLKTSDCPMPTYL